MGYGVEVWRWRERDRIERVKKRYLRWLLGIEGRIAEREVEDKGR